MPLPRGSSREDCISKTYKLMISEGRSKEQARAIALNHCNQIYGGIPKKKNKRNELVWMEELDKIKKLLDVELEDIKVFEEELAKVKKWIQKAVKPSTKGDFGEWCKRHGFKGVCQECINAAARAGGRAAKMALFAVNVSKGKYHYPAKKKKKK